MGEADKIVAAILAAAPCAKAGSTDMDDYVVNYEAIAERLANRKDTSAKSRTAKSTRGKRRA